MKSIQTAVTLIALASVFELSRIESALGYAPKFQIEQLKLISIQINTNLLEEAAKKQEQEDYPGAIADYTEFINTHPNRADAYSSRGFSKAMLEDLAGAIKDYDKAIELGVGLLYILQILFLNLLNLLNLQFFPIHSKS